MKKNTTKVIKEANQYLVMQCIQAFEPVTLEEIGGKDTAEPSYDPGDHQFF